ncbi:MAG TPA: hypothetical protein VFZ65_20545 [Planctomycetota bacterium]|nr:hypothetical protein [Planctomycetota bacterium]
MHVRASMLFLLAQAPTQAPPPLDNGRLRTEFDARGMVAVHDVASNQVVHFAADGLAVVADDTALETAFLPPPAVAATDTTRTFTFEQGAWHLHVVYELRAGWHFVSKQLRVEHDGKREFAVHRVELLRGTLAEPPADTTAIRGGALLRFPGAGAGTSLFALVQNPFGQWRLAGSTFALGYSPEMQSRERSFTSDRCCLSLFARSGHELPQHQLPEWQYVPDGTTPPGPMLDVAETDALVDCARAFLLIHPTKSTRVHIGWCENDYQIDIGTEAGRTEYERVLDKAAAVGCSHVLFTPANDALAPLSGNKDAWGWENVLWLGLGQKIRRDEWLPGRDAVPAPIHRLLEHARRRGLRVLAYVYPSLPFLQQKQWTSWIHGEPGGYRGADTGQRSFQDWLVDELTAFAAATGTAGFSFDHWWIAYDDASSRYAQWDGCRRVLSELRARLPDAVIDGRQQYHGFGVWTWLAGSYPHPLASDEQPESFPTFPDLHWDRASADRQRRTAYAYRTQDFVPVEIMPGYLLHQTPRLDEHGNCPRERFRPRDFDLLGWKYSVISAIATAPFQLVVNFLPARDESEFRAFGPAEQDWLRGWFDWTDKHLDVLRHTRPLLGPVQLGRVDGAAACLGDRGFVFLFNPNYRPLSATFALDANLGLSTGERFVLRQLHPEAGQGSLLAPPSGTTWRFGETATVPMPGAEALVLEIEPAPARPPEPRLAGAVGHAALVGSALALTGVAGEPGRELELHVTLPHADAVRSCTVNDTVVPFTQTGAELTLRARFAGAPFGRCQQLGTYDATFAGGTLRATAAVPRRVFEQLEARRRAWPVPYTADDLRAGYLGSHRLLLYVAIAEPDEAMRVALRVDGAAVPLQPAYSSIVRSNPKNTFVGWFADLSSPAADVVHDFELDVPALAPGQFQGLFFDTVATETTTVIVGA